MRHWPVIVVGFYLLVIVMLVGPILAPDLVLPPLLGEPPDIRFRSLRALSTLSTNDWMAVSFGFGWVLLLAGGPFVLLWTTVAPTPPPRARRSLWMVSLLTAGTFGSLTLFAALSILSVRYGDDLLLPWTFEPVIALLGAWLLWAIVFLRLGDRLLDPATRLYRWIVAGSVLELCVALPSHVIVRRRGDCCAPGVTAFGIAAGVAVLLMTMGPGALFLYRARMRRLTGKPAGSGPPD